MLLRRTMWIYYSAFNVWWGIIFRMKRVKSHLKEMKTADYSDMNESEFWFQCLLEYEQIVTPWRCEAAENCDLSPAVITSINLCKHTTWFKVVVFRSVQLISKSADILVSHCEPPRRLLQVPLQPLTLIFLQRDLTVGLIKEGRTTRKWDGC